MRHTQEAPANLLFDPNNYRFHDLDGFFSVEEERFAEEHVQKRAFERLKSEEGLNQLKRSIKRNGFIPVEALVVRPHASQSGLFVVVEGNRRLAAVKWLLNDHEAGMNLGPDVLDSIQKLPVTIIEEDGPNEVFRNSLMGIRHVSGINRWGGYQQAKLVTQMRDNQGLSAPEAAERLGMSTQELNRRYRAFKALEQMHYDEAFGEYANPKLYPLFHEALSLPAVRKWLEWDENTNQFTNQEELEQFYDLITPQPDDEEREAAPPKLTTYSQVRQLRDILKDDTAKSMLVDPDHGFDEAYARAKSQEMAHRWRQDIRDALTALKSIELSEVKSFTEQDEKLLQDLSDTIAERLDDYKRLRKTD